MDHRAVVRRCSPDRVIGLAAALSRPTQFYTLGQARRGRVEGSVSTARVWRAGAVGIGVGP
jgi:hypothetical protein